MESRAGPADSGKRRGGPPLALTCVDLNERAGRFCKFNSILNKVESPLRFYCGDFSDPGFLSKLGEDDIRYDVVTANPPFVPSYSSQPLYTSAGPRGDELLNATLSFIRSSEEVCRAGIVSEIMNPTGISVERSSVLFYNEVLLGAEEYCRVRDPESVQACKENLVINHVSEVSTGLILFDREKAQLREKGMAVVVRKGRDGGLWTLWNKLEAVLKETWPKIQ